MTKGKFPNGLRDVMDANNVGVTELGDALDESKQNILRWRDGERRLKPEMALRIAKHFGVSVNSLLLLPEETHEVAQPARKKITDAKLAAALLETLDIVPDGDGPKAYKLLMSVFGEDDETQPQSRPRDLSSPATRPRAKSP